MNPIVRGLLWLALALLPAMLIWTALAVMAVIGWCGISGCGSDGFGQTTDMRPMSVLAMSLSGIVLGVPVAAVDWGPSVRVRLIVAATVGLVATLGLVLFVTAP